MRILALTLATAFAISFALPAVAGCDAHQAESTQTATDQSTPVVVVGTDGETND